MTLHPDAGAALPLAAQAGGGQPGGRAGPDGRVSPLLADTLEGAPPAFVAMADCDILADEGAADAARLVAAGVPTLLRRWPGHIHGFVSMGRYIEAARHAVDDAVAARRSLALGDPTPADPGWRGL